MEITSPIICPHCRSKSFETVDGKLECSSCGTYPVEDVWVDLTPRPDPSRFSDFLAVVGFLAIEMSW